MELSQIIKIAAIAMSCKNRAKALLAHSQQLDDQTFDALIAYTDNVLDTINILSEVLEDYHEKLNSDECLLLLFQVKENIEKSSKMEEFLSKYISMSVH
jgi:hypothetical protein